MKKKLLSLLLILPLCVSAQTKAYVANTAIHVLFRSYDNPVLVQHNNTAISLLNIKCDNATITKKGAMWIVNPYENAPEHIVLSIYSRKDGKDVLVGEQPYRVMDLPKQVAFIAYNHARFEDKQRVARTTLISSKTEVAVDYMSESMMSDSFIVKGFSLVIGSQKFESESNRFSREMVEAIKKLRMGTSITIMGIQAIDQQGNKIIVKPIKLIVN